MHVRNLRSRLRALDMQGRISLLRPDRGLMSSKAHPVSPLRQP